MQIVVLYLFYSRPKNKIFINDQLVASIGCSDTCKTIVQFLKTPSSRQEIPAIIQASKANQYFHDMKLRP